MFEQYSSHNLFRDNLELFKKSDPHLRSLAQMKYQFSDGWWKNLSPQVPGIYILTGGRQVGKSTSCKQLIEFALENNSFTLNEILYLPGDEIYDAKELSRTLRMFVDTVKNKKFLLVIDEVTFVPAWERVIKSLADEGVFKQGLCIITGSDSLILKEAAMSFPGRRGNADQVDFHLYPLSFHDYVKLIRSGSADREHKLADLFQHYLMTGGYLRAINDYAEQGQVTAATYLTYEQWIRGDFLKNHKQEDYLLNLLAALIQLGVLPISYSAFTQKIGLMSKETCIDYLRLLERMDVIFNLQAYDQNKKLGFPRKDRKFHFFDPFIQHTVNRWLMREGYIKEMSNESTLVEACVASHCYRNGKTYYFKGQGEIDVIWLQKNLVKPIEVKWTNQLRASDLKTLKQFKDSIILGKNSESGKIDNIQVLPVYEFLMEC